MLLLPGILIDVVRGRLLAHLTPDKLQCGEVEPHFVLLASQDPSQRRADPIQHRTHRLAGDDLAMMRFEHEEEDPARKRHVPLAVGPDVEEGEERRDLGEG